MPESNHSRLNELLPYGLLATKSWLEDQGLSRHTIDNALKSGKLLALSTAVYSQYTRNLRWEGVVASLQRMDGAPVPTIHLGGLTALYLSGLSHYVTKEPSAVHLYSLETIPAWLTRLSIVTAFRGHRVKTLWVEHAMTNIKLLKPHQWERDLPALYYSCPEKAILEVLASVPKAVTFEHADELMQGLVNLSPRKLDTVLKACVNIKVKRLFFWLAKRQAYSWFKQLDDSQYELGSGKRVIERAGRLDKDYLITVPAKMQDQ